MGNAFAFETITVLDKPIELSQIVYAINMMDNPRTVANITVEGGHIRYRYDSDNPTITSGHLLAHGDSIVLDGITNVTNFKAIKVSDRPGILSVTYERAY